MERFQWTSARSLEEAQEQISATTAEVVSGKKSKGASILKAGGVDLLDLMKEGIATPDKVVSIRNIAGLKGIAETKEGLRIGALTTLSEIEEHKEIKESFRALYESVAHAATPQIRNMATLGGNLAQRPRCWYFRSEYHTCKKKGGSVCFAQEGQNEIHAIFNTSICPCVHSSSVSTALMALKGMVEIKDESGKIKSIPLQQFFTLPDVDVTRENILKPKEIITAVILPKEAKGTKSYYIKQAAKESYDWALADVAVVMEMNGNQCKNASVVLGAAAPVPLQASGVEDLLKGKSIDQSLAESAAEMAVKDATPLSDNAYKIPMFKAIIKRCILKSIEI